MKLSERISVLAKLGEKLSQPDAERMALIKASYRHNLWFTEDNYEAAIQAIAERMLKRSLLEEWVKPYPISDTMTPEVVGMVLAGNIPLVGFHDVLSTFICGHIAQIKLSDKDKLVLPYLIDQMVAIDERVRAYFIFVERLSRFDRVIATGSNNTARYFELYFGKYPNIIRKNRNAVAVLSGHESEGALHALGKDVFTYFGLGCRNVSKLYVPKGYEFQPLLEQLHEYRKIIELNKYKNNFDYNFTLLILNKTKYFSNGCILIYESELIQSRIASLHFEYYEDQQDLQNKLEPHREAIQCVVSDQPVENWKHIALGDAQTPALDDYADGVDTLAFLTKTTTSIT